MNLKLILYGIAVAALIGAGLYLRHLQKEADRVDELVATINTQRTQIENERTQMKDALERENAINKDLEAARSTAADLASRLRRAYAASLSDPSSGSTESPGASGTGSGPDPLDAAVAGIIGACKADSIRLGEWQRWHERALEAME